MTSLSRRRRDGWMSLFRRRRPSDLVSGMLLLDEEQFLLAIRKERSRAERRDLAFSILKASLDNGTDLLAFPEAEELLQAFRQRLRITDEIGVFGNSIGILLPETIASEAAIVANELTRIAAGFRLSLATDILVWPEPVDGQLSESEGGKGGFHHPGNGSPPRERELLDDLNSGSVAVAQQATRPALKSDASAIKVSTLEFSHPVPFWKRALDFSGAAAGLILLSPVMLGAAMAIKLTSPGPVFFRQWREGKDGKLFRIYKFRTMRRGADSEKHLLRQFSEQDGPAFKLKNDPRLTRIGKYLRRCCVDELPQLINVWKGEMSLVGPRPLPADESLSCTRWQRRRLEVLPGMTCIWQVSGGRDIPFDDWMRMDLQYVREITPSNDIRLLFHTALVAFFHRGSV
jgi:lipopolysaccharide/colanic/teichoic acid biosynthesis glycosyltransferase